MATALDIIKRAMRLAKILDAATVPDASDSQDGLATLNALLAEMHQAEVGLPDYELDGLATELASDAADREALAYMLARRIAPEYGMELTGLIAKEAEQSESRLRLRYFQPGTTDLSELPSVQNHYDAVSDA